LSSAATFAGRDASLLDDRLISVNPDSTWNQRSCTSWSWFLTHESFWTDEPRVFLGASGSPAPYPESWKPAKLLSYPSSSSTSYSNSVSTSRGISRKALPPRSSTPSPPTALLAPLTSLAFLSSRFSSSPPSCDRYAGCSKGGGALNLSVRFNFTTSDAADGRIAPLSALPSREILVSLGR
jgi:hypothetical protein